MRIHQKGCGEAIVFVHGLVGTHKVFSKQFEAFSSNFRVISYDYIGHGGRDIKLKAFTLPNLVEELRKVYAEAGIQKAHLCSLSFGSYISNEFAYQYPELVSSLCHIGGSFNGNFQLWDFYKILWECRDKPYKEWIQQFSNVITDGDKETFNKSHSIFVKHAMTTDASVLYEAVRLRVFYDMRTILSKLNIPMLWVLGECDHLYQSCLDDLFKIYPNVKYLELHGAPHVAHIFQPETFEKEYCKFLRDVSSVNRILQ